MSEPKKLAWLVGIFVIEEIITFGTAFTPALVIDGEVKSQGKLPSSEQIAAWIGEATAKP